jgi:endonuclease-3 related protein
MDLRQVFDALFEAYGHQHWWPGETPFEIMVGAILTQNTAWTNVERAIANLTENDSLDPERILAVDSDQLAEWLRPSGYFNIKAQRLRNFCRWYLEQGGYDRLKRWDTERLRTALLSVKGVGPETADDILLYAFERPVFVIDAYTRRLLVRLGLASGEESYEALRARFENFFGREPKNADLFNEYHALIVEHAKCACRKRPNCRVCPLAQSCSHSEPASD